MTTAMRCVRSFIFLEPNTDSADLKPSHHIPYLYALAGAASKTQERVREIAKANYNNTPIGLSGVNSFVRKLALYH
jgi:putative alpha-1,2-mannosidase